MHDLKLEIVEYLLNKLQLHLKLQQNCNQCTSFCFKRLTKGAVVDVATGTPFL